MTQSANRRQKRRDAEIIKVTCLDENADPAVARFVLYLDSVQEWHVLRKYVTAGKAEGWEGKYSCLAAGVKLSYVRVEDPWAIQLIRQNWA